MMRRAMPVSAILCLVFLVCAGCKKKDNDPPVLPPPDYVNLDLTDSGGVLGISYTFEDGTYSGDLGAVPAGSIEFIPGVMTLVQAGVPWFDSTSIPATATIVSAKLVLEVSAAPADPITVHIYDLTSDPTLIDPYDSAQCQAVYEDAVAGALYAQFDVDSSQATVEVTLGAEAIADIQAVLSGAGGFGVGLRAPDADESNLVNIIFSSTAYLEVGYR